MSRDRCGGVGRLVVRRSQSGVRAKRSTSTPWRRPRSLTVRTPAQPSITVRTMQAPARMTSARLGWRPTIAAAGLGVAGAVLLDLPVDLGPVECGALDAVGIVRRSPSIHRREVRDGPAHPHQRVRRRPAVQA